MGLLLCVALAAQQPQISYSCLAKRAPLVVEELAALTGRKLRTGSKVENDVLVIDVKNVSTDALLERIAWAVNGTWEQSEDGYTLVRTQVQERQEYSDEIRKRTADYAAAIAKDAMELGPELDVKSADALARQAFETAKEPDIAKRFNGLNSLSKRSPAGKLLTRLLLAIGPAELATIPGDERRVYTFAPTNLQRQIPAIARAHVTTFAREQATYAQAYPNAPGASETPPYFTGLGIGSPKPVRGEPQLQVSVTNEANSTLRAALIVVDDEGQVAVHSASFNRFSPLPPAPPQEPDPTVQLSEESQRYLRLRRETEKLIDNVVPPELERFFYQPETNDPLQLVVSDALMAWARHDQRNLVAAPQDSVLSWLSRRGASAGSLRLFADFVNQTRRAFEVRRESEWLGIRSSALYLARGNRTSREDLGRQLRSLRKTEAPSFQSAADLALAMPYDPNTNLASFVVYAVPEVSQLGYYSRSLLQLWRSLNPQQSAAAHTTIGLSVRRLSREQQDLLVSHLCYSSGMFTNEPPRHDPTYRYGDGRLLDHDIGFALKRELGAQTVSTPSGYSYQSSMDLRTLAHFYLQSKHPEHDPLSGALAGSKFRPAELTQFEFRVLLNGGAYFGSNYSYATKQPGAEAFTFAELPESIKEEVLKHYEELKKQMGIGDD